MRTLICLLLTCLTSLGAGYRIRDLPPTNGISGPEMLELDDGTKSWRITSLGLVQSMMTNNDLAFYSTNLITMYQLMATNCTFVSVNAETNINNYSYVTNLYDQRAFISTNYSTNIYSTTAYITNLYSTTEYVTNLTAVTNFNSYNYATNIYSTTEVVSNVFATNIYVNYLVASNLLVLESTNNLADAASNIVVNMDMAGLEVTVTNNITLTNFTGLANGTTKTRVVFLQVTVGGPWSVVYPSDGASYGVYWATNCLPQANRPYTSVTNGSTYVLSLTSRGTNIYSAMTEWK